MPLENEDAPRGAEEDPLSTTAPQDIKLNLKSQELRIEWRDGHRSTFPLGRLRRACPCATCRREREAPPTRLPILNTPPGSGPLKVVDAELVGHYAINLKWSDGHDTGIYDYKYLRSLDRESPND